MSGFWWGFSEAFKPLQAVSPILENLQRKIDLQSEIERATAMLPLKLKELSETLNLQSEYEKKLYEYKMIAQDYPDIIEHLERVRRGDTQDPLYEKSKNIVQTFADIMGKIGKGIPLSDEEIEQTKQIPVVSRAKLLIQNINNYFRKLEHETREREREATEQYYKERTKISEEELKLQRERLGMEKTRMAEATERTVLSNLFAVHRNLTDNYRQIFNQFLNIQMKIIQERANLATIKDKKQREKAEEAIVGMEIDLINKYNILKQLENELNKLNNQIYGYFQIELPTISATEQPPLASFEHRFELAQKAPTPEDALKVLGLPPEHIGFITSASNFPTIKNSWSKLSKEQRAAFLKGIIDVYQSRQQ